MDIDEMLKEYDKGGKFADYVNKGCAAYRDTKEDECRKAIVQEYYKSVVNGCNKEKEST